MTSKIYLDETWTQLATGDCVIEVQGRIALTFSALAPVGTVETVPHHLLDSTDDDFNYAGTGKAWAQALEPGSLVIVSGAAEEPSRAPVARVAPVVATPPSLTPADPVAGDEVVIDLGSATGAPVPVADAELIADGKRVALDILPVVLAQPGPWSLAVTWRNGVAPNAIATLQGTVADPGGTGGTGGGTPPVVGNAYLATVTARANDWKVYDSGYHRGINAAPVPLSGTATLADGTTPAPDGTIIQARAVSQDDGGANTGAWQDIGVVTAGAYSGVLSVPRPNAYTWFKEEVRAKGTSAAAAVGSKFFAAGHVIMNTNQSISEYAMYTRATAISVARSRQVQIHCDTPTGGLARIFPGITPTGYEGLTHIAQKICENAHDIVALGIDAKSGSAIYFSLMSTATDPGGRLARTILTRDALQSDGAKIGAYVMDHHWTGRGDGVQFMARYHPMLFGVKIDGSNFDIATEFNFYTPTTKIDAVFFDVTGAGRGIFDHTYTKCILASTHAIEDASSVTYKRLDISVAGADTAQGTRRSIRSYLAAPPVPAVAAILSPILGADVVALQNGNASPNVATGPSWVDMAHPADEAGGLTLGGYPDGSSARCEGLGTLFAQAMGAIGDQPYFDQIHAEPDGSKVTIWSSAGPITTKDYERSGVTDVAGITVDKILAVATLNPTTGRVEVAPPKGLFYPSSRIRFGEGGGGLGVNVTADLITRRVFNRYPLVKSLAGATWDRQAFPARPLKMVGGGEFTLSGLSGGRGVNFAAGSFWDTKKVGYSGQATLPTGTRAIRMEAHGAFTVAGGNIFSMENGRFGFGAGAVGPQTMGFFIGVDNTVFTLPTTANLTWVPGEMQKIVLTVDLDAGANNVNAYVDGVLVSTATRTGTAFTTGRGFTLNPGNAGRIVDAAIYLNAAGTGTPWFQVTGDAAAMSAHTAFNGAGTLTNA